MDEELRIIKLGVRLFSFARIVSTKNLLEGGSVSVSCRLLVSWR